MEKKAKIVSPKKFKKSQSADKEEEFESPAKKSKAVEKIVSNGTGNFSSTSPDDDSPTEKNRTIKITKISKVSKTDQKRDRTRSASKEEPSNTIPSSIESPSTSKENDFYGFDEEPIKTELKEKHSFIIKKLEQLAGEISVSENVSSAAQVEDIANQPENKIPERDMTIDDTGHISDSDSNKMEIDEGNDKDVSSKTDSVEFSDNQEKGARTKDSDVDIMETDSVNSVDISKNPENETKKTDSSITEQTEKVAGSHAKVEYCGGCGVEVDDAEEGICCDGKCERWFHLGCSGLSQDEYEELGRDQNAKWACTKCSGKPLPPETKAVIAVRKDLTPASTPTPIKRKSANREGLAKTPKVDISNPAFLKPFDFGWKRELVHRSTTDTQNRRQGDVYYYTPKGKKLRSLREISEHLAGSELTIDNFTFWKDPLGIDDPEKEIIRDAKLKSVNRDSSASPAAPKKITPKAIKTPKSAPKLTATVTPLDSSSGLPVQPSVPTTPKASASVTPRVVFKGGKTGLSMGPKFKVTPSKNNVPGQTQKIVISKDKKKKETGDDELEMGMLPPMWEPAPKPKDNANGVKRPLDNPIDSPPSKRPKIDPAPVLENFMQNMGYMYNTLLHAFQYLKVQELLRASRVCHLWRDIALNKSLWETVRMKNSQVKDWEGFSATLRRVGTRHLDLRKILMSDKQDALRTMWSDCIKALSKVNTLVKLDLCRCTAYLLEQIGAACPQLEYIAACAIKSNQVNLSNIGNCQNLTELKLKGQGGMELSNVEVLANLSKLKQLSLTTVRNMNAVLEVVGKMTQLESLELGDFVAVSETVVTESFSKLTRLRRLRLEKGQHDCPTDAILKTLSQLPSLVQLELINFDVKVGFEESLALCTNIKILLIIPTYVTQSATTNHLLIEGVSKLSKSLNYFVWGLTLELLRVTDLFIDQWEMGQKNTNVGAKSPNQAPSQKKPAGDSIPILKPQQSKDGKKSKEGAVTQVDVLQLPKLHKVLTTLLPTTKITILKVPFSATWRQTISGSTQ